MKKICLLILLLPLYLIANEIKPNRSIVYKTVGKTKLQLNIFEPNNLKPTDSRPAIVFFFGGGWSSGTPKQFYQQARAMADLGMIAFTADYRVKSRNKTTPLNVLKMLNQLFVGSVHMPLNSALIQNELLLRVDLLADILPRVLVL